MFPFIISQIQTGLLKIYSKMHDAQNHADITLLPFSYHITYTTRSDKTISAIIMIKYIENIRLIRKQGTYNMVLCSR